MVTIGLDISSSKVGVAVIDADHNIKVSEVIKFKTSLSLEERAEIFAKKMAHLEKHYVAISVYIESPALMFKGGKTTAQTMAKLQRFNGMCSYIAYKIFDVMPTMVNASSARRALEIKIPRGQNSKRIIIDWVKAEYDKEFEYKITRHGNPQPGTDDLADAIITALGGLALDKEH